MRCRPRVAHPVYETGYRSQNASAAIFSNSETLLIDNIGGVYLHDTQTNTTTLLADYALEFTDIAVTQDGSVYANTFGGL